MTSKSVDGTANASRSTVEDSMSSAKSHHVSPGLGFWYGNKNLPGRQKCVKEKRPWSPGLISPGNKSLWQREKPGFGRAILTVTRLHGPWLIWRISIRDKSSRDDAWASRLIGFARRHYVDQNLTQNLGRGSGGEPLFKGFPPQRKFSRRRFSPCTVAIP